MWIVSLALRRPYTFVVVAMLIAVLGVFEVLQMPTDILPEIDIPVVAVVWTYNGLPPEEMEQRFTGLYERTLTSSVNGIEHMDSQSLYGVAVVKVFFQPGTKVEMANAQITAVSQTILKQLPIGSTPPQIINYSASNVPILQGSVHSDSMSEQELFDLSSNFLRVGMATVQGAQLPTPYGGKQRQVMVDIDLPRLYALGLSPQDVNLAVQAQNLVLPSGTAKIGDQELLFRPNGSPDAVAQIASLPLKTAHGATVLIKDVATVRDGFAPQTSLVRANGRRGVLVTVLKSAGASTLDIVNRVKVAIPRLIATLPPAFKLDFLFDQSLYVRAAIGGVLKEASIAAGLTALMILLFLGSWRSTLIVITSIPLSILVSLIILGCLGQTLNLMTLGGLSLAVGILVDDATVELENVHRNLGMRKPIVTAILDGAQQIAVPALVATLCICIVFIPVAFISGAARSLFTPLGMAVVFAMMTSYFLSRTLVPTMVNHLLGAEVHLYAHGEGPTGRQRRASASSGTSTSASTSTSSACAARYGGFLDVGADQQEAGQRGLRSLRRPLARGALPRPRPGLLPQRSTPGRCRMHVRCQPGHAHRGPPSALIEQVEDEIRRAWCPRTRWSTVLDNIGVPVSGLNLALGDSFDDLLRPTARSYVQLSEESSARPRATSRSCVGASPSISRSTEVFFLAPDITTQVLNFGLSAPIDIQVVGPPVQPGRRACQVAQDAAREPHEGARRRRRAPAAAGRRPAGGADERRPRRGVRAGLSPCTTSPTTGGGLAQLQRRRQPNYWLDPKKGVQYLVAVQTPQYDSQLVRRRPSRRRSPAQGVERAGDPRQPRAASPATPRR